MREHFTHLWLGGFIYMVWFSTITIRPLDIYISNTSPKSNPRGRRLTLRCTASPSYGLDWPFMAVAWQVSQFFLVGLLLWVATSGPPIQGRLHLGLWTKLTFDQGWRSLLGLPCCQSRRSLTWQGGWDINDPTKWTRGPLPRSLASCTLVLLIFVKISCIQILFQVQVELGEL
jgi:hypothetical protein